MDFKSKLKQKRQELNLTLEELAKKVGVSAATIQRYESGEIKNLRNDKIKRLADALGVTPNYLMDWGEEDSSINTIAAHALSDLTADEQKKVLEFAQFIKSQREKND